MINLSLLFFIVILILLAAPLRKRIPALDGRLINRLFLAYMGVLIIGGISAFAFAGSKAAFPYIGEGSDEPPYIYETVVDEGRPEAVPEGKIAFEKTFPYRGNELTLRNPSGRGWDSMASIVVRRGTPGELTVTAYRAQLLMDGYDLSAATAPKPPVLDQNAGELALGDYQSVDISRIDASFLTVPLLAGGSSGSWSSWESPVYLLTVPEGVSVSAEGPIELTEIKE